MIKTINFRTTRLRYKTSGNGKDLILLHGYLESIEIWDNIFDDLSKLYRVTAIDLLGHGESGIVDEKSSMELMAEAVKSVLDAEGITHCIVLGHSMGGYVMFALAEMYKELMDGLIIYHSICTADPEERKAIRIKTINDLKDGMREEIVRAFIPKTFAAENVILFTEAISMSTKNSLRMSEESIIATLRGIMERANRCSVIQNSSIPILSVIGVKDLFISFEVSNSQAELSNNVQKLILENTGHMGHIEEKINFLNGIVSFINTI